MACHSSNRSIDHTGEVVEKYGKESVLENISLHGTKCTVIFQNVVFLSLIKEQKNDPPIVKHMFYLWMNQLM